MSSRKSETPSPPVLTAAPAGAAAVVAPPRSRRFFRNPGIESLALNLPIPVLLLILIPVAWLIEGHEFNSVTLPGISPYFLTVLMFVGYNIILAVSLQLINGFSGQFSLGHAGFMAVGAYLAAYPAITFSHRFTDPAASFVFFFSLAVVFGIGGLGLLAIFILIRKTRRWHRALPMGLLIGLVAWVLFDFAKGGSLAKPPIGYVWTHAVEDLRRLFLWMNESGAAPAAKISGALPEWIAKPLCFLVLVIGGGCCAGVVGLVVGMPALRLRGDYLAIATLGMGEIIRILIQNSDPLGGALGLNDIPRYTDFTGNGLFWLYAAVIITTVVIWRIGYSAKGRAIMAVREDEIAAAAIGIDATRQKVVAFIVGASFAGVAGSMYGLHERSITPNTFNMIRSIEVVVMVTLGGLGSISGAIVAAIVLTLLPEVLRGIGDYRMIIYSALLILMMLLRPQGLLGGRELWSWKWLRRRLPIATEDRDDRGNA
jgi:branched-chain amino acid transport system permease protein